jgi:hypothetical protein
MAVTYKQALQAHSEMLGAKVENDLIIVYLKQKQKEIEKFIDRRLTESPDLAVILTDNLIDICPTVKNASGESFDHIVQLLSKWYPDWKIHWQLESRQVIYVFSST